MHAPLALAIAFVPFLSFVPGGSPALERIEEGGDDYEIDFQALADSLIKERCPGGAPCTLDDVVARQAFADIGPFRVVFPREILLDKEGSGELKDVLLGLHGASEEWVRWQGAGDALTDESKAIKKWASKWKPLKEKELAKRGDVYDLFELIETPPEVRDAFAAVGAVCDSTEELALVVPEGRQVRLILAPTRKEFMQWAGFSGVVDPSLKDVNWHTGAASWGQFWLGWDIVIALQYAPWDGFDPTFEKGKKMSEISEGLMTQHVVQQAFQALLHTCRPNAEKGRNESALAMLMTIQACGEINTIEGAGGVGTSGARTNPYEKFVPGGNPAGGILPARSASQLDGLVENRWREGHGGDAFRKPLREGQKTGGKSVKKERKKDPLAHFVLQREDGTGEHLIHAPFFGPHANEQAYPPAEYLVDYAEFYRAYKTCFWHWIRTSAADPKDDAANAEAWSRVIRGLADQEVSFDAIVEEVYGLPISGRDATTESLEFRFLAALPKLK